MKHPGNSHFLMALGRAGAGGVVETADEVLREVISAVLKTGKKGKVSITMNVSPNGDEGLEVSCDVAATAPRMSFGKSFFFRDATGGLTRESPRLDLGDSGISTIKGGRDA